MATGDYCPRCRGVHDILKDCPPTIEPGVPVRGSISRDLLNAQAEIKRLNLQIEGMRKIVEIAKRIATSEDGHDEIVPLIRAVEEMEAAEQLKEKEFLTLYERVIKKAKELLTEANHTRNEPGDWPAGMKWNDMVGTSKSIFMHRAREAMGIDHDEFLKVVREWPYAGAGMEKIEEMFEGP